jgi:hypothetical protein
MLECSPQWQPSTEREKRAGCNGAEVEPMSRTLQAGDRVRVTVRNRVPGYQPGDKGTLLRGPRTADGDPPYYIVMMDKDGLQGTGIVFAADEIEPDE